MESCMQLYYYYLVRYATATLTMYILYIHIVGCQIPASHALTLLTFWDSMITYRCIGTKNNTNGSSITFSLHREGRVDSQPRRCMPIGN